MRLFYFIRLNTPQVFALVNVSFIHLLLSHKAFTADWICSSQVCPSPLRDSSISLSLALAMKMIGSSSHAPFHHLGNIDSQSNYWEGIGSRARCALMRNVYHYDRGEGHQTQSRPLMLHPLPKTNRSPCMCWFIPDLSLKIFILTPTAEERKYKYFTAHSWGGGFKTCDLLQEVNTETQLN